MLYLKKHSFPFLIAIVCIGIMIFHLWLAWPGYIHNDTPHSLLLTKDNWHPIIIVYALQFLYWIGGVHVYHMLLLIMVPFYLAVFVLFYTLWKRFRSYWSGLALLPIFIANIFFQNFVLHSSSLSPMWIFLCYALSFYPLLNPIRGKIKNILYYAIILLVFSLSLLSRHNAIVQLFPLGVVWLFQLEQVYHLSLKKYFFFIFMILFYTIGVSVGVPKLLQARPSNPAQHIILHQIAGACVPADDDTCFKTEWYQQNADWEKVKNEYKNNPFFADRFSTLQSQYQVFKGEKLKGLYGMWIKSIFRHPYNYAKHVLCFLKRMWGNPVDIENIRDIQRQQFCDGANNWLDGRYGISFPKNEKCITLTKGKTKVYSFLRRYLPFVPTCVFVLISVFGVFLSGGLFLKKDKNILLLFAFATSFFGIASYILFAVFSPTDYYRYMHPALILPIFSVIGICAYYATLKKSHNTTEH